MLEARTHVCLVSAQAAPNLLPALDPNLHPVEVVLLVSKKMQAQAAALESVLSKRGIQVSCIELPDERDFESLRSVLTKLAIERLDGQLALNVTGGTKLMALAAHSVVTGQDRWEVFYVDADTDEVIVLWPRSCRQVLSAELRMADYLRAYGYEPDYVPVGHDAGMPLNKACVELMRDLVLNVGSLEQPLGQLNWLAQQAKDRSGLRVCLSEEQQDSRSLESLLRKFADAGVLFVEGTALHFVSEAHRAYAQGGWLEEYVSRTVGSAKKTLGVRDHDANVTVSGRGGDTYELDVAFMARNRLHVIECKTARMDGPRASKANDVLFKVAEISRNVGGLGARAMLVSYRSLSEHERRLAHALSIKLVAGEEIRRLDEKLKSWVLQ